MIGGFALVAYPAEYRNSGVMSFIVNHDGVVFQKDLGSDTTQRAEPHSIPINPGRKSLIPSPHGELGRS
jgi:hypothetical protein